MDKPGIAPEDHNARQADRDDTGRLIVVLSERVAKLEQRVNDLHAAIDTLISVLSQGNDSPET